MAAIPHRPLEPKEQEKALKEYTMKTLRRFCVVFVLALALSLSAFAGDIHTGITAPPPPPQATSTGEITTGVTGEISTGVTGDISTTATDPTTDIFLSLLQSLLSLF
jgi:hypothetical protein